MFHLIENNDICMTLNMNLDQNNESTRTGQPHYSRTQYLTIVLFAIAFFALLCSLSLGTKPQYLHTFSSFAICNLF